MAGWYIRRGEKIIGPIQLDQLQELAADGRLQPGDFLSQQLEGPWQTASKTELFAKSGPRTDVVSAKPAVPTVADRPSVNLPRPSVVRIVATGLGKGALVTWKSFARIVATHSQRRHELKLAKIQAKAIQAAQPPVPATPPPPILKEPPPQRHEQPAGPTIQNIIVTPVIRNTVVTIPNRRSNDGFGCVGCIVILLVLGILGIGGYIVNQIYPNIIQDLRDGKFPPRNVKRM